MKDKEIKNIVKENYANIAKGTGCCCTCSCKQKEQEQIAKNIGYSKKELNVPGNLG